MLTKVREPYISKYGQLVVKGVVKMNNTTSNGENLSICSLFEPTDLDDLVYDEQKGIGKVVSVREMENGAIVKFESEECYVEYPYKVLCNDFSKEQHSELVGLMDGTEVEILVHENDNIYFVKKPLTFTIVNKKVFFEDEVINFGMACFNAGISGEYTSFTDYYQEKFLGKKKTTAYAPTEDEGQE